jgi:putative iron-dependent peroxidase
MRAVMNYRQPAVLAAVPTVARFLVFSMRHRVDARPALGRIGEATLHDATAIGFGSPLVLSLRASIPNLRGFVPHVGPSCAFPSTQGAVWACVGGDDVGDVFDRARAFRALLGDDFAIDEEVAAFRYRGGRDLSGYEDGTENPKDEKAVAAAIVTGAGEGLDGSSFVATQRWVHDLARFGRMPEPDRDAIVGRRISTNEEIADAPSSAHVKRTAQESFDPPAFVVRRSMPWGGAVEHGLYFVAYGASLDPFERQLARMAGTEDGIVDGLLRFSRALSGGYYWCPPRRGARLDLRALGV